MRDYVALLRAGGVVACPTETQIGLLADARSEAAVERVCALKRRPAGEPIPLIVPSLELACELAELSARALELAARHWPGPLTLVVRARVALPAALTKHGTIALRVPGASPAQTLVREFGGALTSTSANLSGQPPLRDADELRASFGAALSAIVPGTPPGGLPSTIVDVTAAQPIVLRYGALKLEL